MKRACTQCERPHYARGLCKRCYSRQQRADRRERMGTLDPTSDSAELVRRQSALRNGFCPLCTAGPFKAPLIHLSKVHGMSAYDVRVLCEVLLREKVTDPDYSERRAQLARLHLIPHRVSNAGGYTMRRSPAAVRSWVENLKQFAAQSTAGEIHRQRVLAAQSSALKSRAINTYWARRIDVILEDDPEASVAKDVFPLLKREGYSGSLSPVQRYVRRTGRSTPPRRRGGGAR